MDEKKNNGTQDPNEPSTDEGWWSSVLNDENIIAESQTSHDLLSNEYEINMSNVDWDYVQRIYHNDSIISLHVYGFNRGGLLVEGENIQGFVPISHLTKMSSIDTEMERHESLSGYIGSNLSLKVIECTPIKKRIVFSERAALAGEGQRNNLFASLKINDLITGKVTNITKFGVFVDLGGIEGLIHISELSWGRVQNAAEHVKIGQEIQVMILQINEHNGRIALSLKRLETNPWVTVSQKYKIGDFTPAVITTITHFGAFARLQEGIEGLIHISSMSNDEEDLNFLHNRITPGDAVTVKILHIDTNRHRLGLGLVKIE